MALTNEEIIEALKEMPLLQASELVKAIEEEFGVSAAAPVAVAAVGELRDICSVEACGSCGYGVKQAGKECLAAAKPQRQVFGLKDIEKKSASKQKHSTCGQYDF